MKSVSVVLCVRNGSDVLPNVVRSVFEAASTVAQANVELLIVDNGSTDATVATAEALKHNAPIPVRIFLEPVKGVCRAKNRGIQSARGDIIAFTDDDCVLAPNYFADLIRHYEGEVASVIRGGRVELGDPTDLPFTIKVDDQPAVFGGIIHPGGFVHGCNLTIPRNVFDKIGGFDERFGPGAPFTAGEETELIYRAHKVHQPSKGQYPTNRLEFPQRRLGFRRGRPRRVHGLFAHRNETKHLRVQIDFRAIRMSKGGGA
jgi:glycosyltransferase involved in cell wall biosynthesis